MREIPLVRENHQNQDDHGADIQRTLMVKYVSAELFSFDVYFCPIIYFVEERSRVVSKQSSEDA